MKSARIIQVVLVIALIIYLVFLDRDNPGSSITLPLTDRFLPPLPPAWILALVIVASWLVGWLPGRLTLWRKGREVRQLRRKIQELEQHVPSYDQDRQGAKPVIPDRNPLSTQIPPLPDNDRT
ncbi:MAG: hypothetical protein OXC09_13640 [Truepera sp.]|nr:hypothetical protein [Truepera sp.]